MRFPRGLVWAGLAAAVSFGAPASAPPAFAAETPPASAAAAPATGPAPRISFATTTVDLGDVVRGNDAVAEFSYSNTGDAPLKILSAKPG